MPYTPAPFLKAQWFDANGNPLASGRLFFYAAGTATKQNTYTTSAGSVANANPVVLDAAGRADVFFQTGLSYKIVAAAAGSDDPPSSPLWTEDNITPTPGDTVYPDSDGTAGATITAGDAVYLSDGSGALTSGRWYRCDSGTDYKSSTAQSIGFALNSASAAGAVSVRLMGVVSGLAGLTAGTVYYVGSTGAVTSSAPSLARRVGVGISTTELLVSHFQQQVDASATSPGLVTVGTQTIAGAKTFSGAVTFGSTVGASGALSVTAPISFRPGTSASGSVLSIGNVASYSGAGVGNAAGGGTTTLFSHTLPAGSMVSGGVMTVRFAGSKVNNADAKTLNVSIGGTALTSISLATGAGDDWMAEYIVFWDSATQARFYRVGFEATSVRSPQTGTAAVTWANANAVLITGASATADNILLEMAAVTI